MLQHHKDGSSQPPWKGLLVVEVLMVMCFCGLVQTFMHSKHVKKISYCWSGHWVLRQATKKRVSSSVHQFVCLSIIDLYAWLVCLFGWFVAFIWNILRKTYGHFHHIWLKLTIVYSCQIACRNTWYHLLVSSNRRWWKWSLKIYFHKRYQGAENNPSKSISINSQFTLSTEYLQLLRPH